MEIDLNRGVVQRKHPDGYTVSMYKDAPGYFLDPNANPVSEEMAKRAGFPVEDLRKERIRREKLAEAESRIQSELASERDRIEKESSEPATPEPAPSPPESARNGHPTFSAETHRVQHRGRGRYAIVSKETDEPVPGYEKMDEKEAEALLAQGGGHGG